MAGREGMNKFVVSSTGRSGTRYTQSVLNKTGLTVSHEQVFGLHGFRKQGWGKWDGCVSGLAPPLLRHHPDLLVFHQVRHPLAVIRSMLTRNSSKRSIAHEKEYLVPAGFPDEGFKGRRLRHSCLIWLHRNELTEMARPALRWRVEDMDAETLRKVLELIGWEATDETLADRKSVV